VAAALLGGLVVIGLSLAAGESWASALVSGVPFGAVFVVVALARLRGAAARQRP